MQTTMLKPHGNSKPKIYNRCKQKMKKQFKHNTNDSHKIKKESKIGRQEKRHAKTNTKQLTTWL